MDYEKKYNEALERAKKFEEKYGGGYAEYIFPELAESEDVRIRKWLVNYFKAAGKSWIHRDISPEQILAYLEKQKERVPENEETGTRKEQKPDWSEEDEKTISDACCWIAEYAGYFMDKNWGKASMLMSLMEKLKSLRPSWKPSEEQQSGSSALKAEGTNE